MQFNRQWKEFLMEERNPELLAEARVRDVKAKYPTLDKSGWINWARRQLQETLGDKGVSKYILWFVRELDAYVTEKDPDELRGDPDMLELAESIMDRVMLFQQYQYQFDEKDIYKFDDKELKKQLDSLGVTADAKAAKAAADKKKAEAESEIVYNEKQILAIRPLTTHASCYYGENPRLNDWCISTTTKQNYFVRYTEEEGKAFVMTRFFGIPEEENEHFITLQFDYDGDIQMFWDHANESRDPDDLFSVIGAHLEGLEEYKGQDEDERDDLVSEIYGDLLDMSRNVIQDDPPPDPVSAAEKACEEIQQEAERDLQHVQVHYEVMEDYGARVDQPYVNFSATLNIELDIYSKPFVDAPEDIIDISSGEQQVLEREIESRLRDAGIYGIEEVSMYFPHGTDRVVQIDFQITEGDEFTVEGFREFVNFTAAQFDNQANDIERIINAILTEKEYYAPSGQQMKLPGIEEDIRKYFNNNHLTKQGFYDSIEKDIIKEEKGRSRQRGIYKFYCMLSYGLTIEENRSRGLDDILADLRALPNVTIVTVVVKNQKVAEGRYIAGLSVKFIPSIPGQFNAPEDVKTRILRDVKRLGNVQTIFKVSAGLERLE